MDDYKYKALQTLTRARFFTVQNLTREKQHFANYLFLKCSGLAREKVLSQNTSATTIALMDSWSPVWRSKRRRAGFPRRISVRAC